MATRNAKSNFSYLYDQEAASLDFQVRVYHATVDHSTIHFKLRTRDLLYKSKDGGKTFRSLVRVSYEAYSDWKTKMLLDSSSTYVVDESLTLDQDKELIGSMEMQRKGTTAFVLRITAHDLARGTHSSVLVDVTRTGEDLRQAFLPMETERDLPYFDDHFVGPKQIRVLCEQFAGRDLFGGHHKQTFNLPSPVFAYQAAPTMDLSADSSFRVHVDDQGYFLLDAQRMGYYHFRPDSASNSGATFFFFNAGYPYVQRAQDMVEPLRYITSMQEYDRISNATNTREAVEGFWLDAAGAQDRARSAIRAYYERVESANRYFTSYVEGWRTDRGLVHIIFGTPNTIHKNAGGETWIYGEENNMMSLAFNFSHRNVPYTGNDLVLDRDPTFKGAWYRNVESWRNGRVLQN